MGDQKQIIGSRTQFYQNADRRVDTGAVTPVVAFDGLLGSPDRLT